jgi:hypothetical protein
METIKIVGAGRMMMVTIIGVQIYLESRLKWLK